MKVKVEERIYDLEQYTDEEKIRLFRMWHAEKPPIYCMCHGLRSLRPPVLHLVNKNGKFHLKNNPSNHHQRFNRSPRYHAFHCRFNLKDGYRQHLLRQGIRINEDGEIVCKIGGGIYNNVVTEPLSSLRTLFLTILKERSIDEYHPKTKRNVADRIYNMANLVRNGRQSLKNRVYMARKSYFPNYKTHQLLIGWGNLDKYPVRDHDKDFLQTIPFLDLDHHDHHVVDMTILKSAVQQATYTHARVHTGYWVLWRDPKPKGNGLTDRFLIFVPAEPETMIPIDSTYEADMNLFLVKKNRHFLKPIIGNVTDMFLDYRPDIVLRDSSPNCIIEVAGTRDQKNYKEKLYQKRKLYQSKGYKYVEWDGLESLDLFYQKERL